MTETVQRRKKACWVEDENCKGSINKEHVISNSILRELGPMLTKVGDKTIQLGSASSVVRTFCEYHNSKASCFDAEALKLIRTWKKYATPNDFAVQLDQEVTVINIDSLERWLLKSFVNSIVQRMALDKNLKVMQPDFQTLKQYIFRGAEIKPPFGVYMMNPESMIFDTNKWSYSPEFQPIEHISAETKILTKYSSPTVFIMKLGNVELVGFFNLTGINDMQALDSLLKGWHQRLETQAVYRKDIKFGCTSPADTCYDGVRPTRQIIFD